MKYFQYGRGSFFVILAVFALLAVSVGACTPAAIPETGAAAVDIEVTETGVTAPQQVSPGIATINITNTSDDPRVLMLALLNPDLTVDQFRQAVEQENFENISLVTFKGGGDATPGEENQIIVDLDEGTYVAMGFPQSDAPPIFGSFQVGGGSASQASAPEAGVLVNLSDFTFDMPNEVPAGAQTWELRNTGDQWHEMILFKLQEGTTEEELVQMLMSDQEPQGPPPFEGAGYFGPVSNGHSFWVPLDLEPGTYAAVCFLPNLVDPASGKAHVEEGMVKIFQVTGS